MRYPPLGERFQNSVPKRWTGEGTNNGRDHLSGPAHDHKIDKPPSVDLRFDDRGERGSRAIEPRFHRTQIALRDLGDLLVRLALELAKHEHLSMMLGQPR